MCGKSVGILAEGQRVGWKTVDFLQVRYNFCSDDCKYHFGGQLYPAEFCDKLYKETEEE